MHIQWILFFIFCCFAWHFVLHSSLLPAVYAAGKRFCKKKLDAKFVFLKCKVSIQSEATQQVVWKNENQNLRWKISGILPAFSVCPSRDAIVNRPVRHLNAAETGSVNMRWFQFNKDLFLKCVWDRTYPSPLWWRRLGVCLCALVQTWCIAPHVAVSWEASEKSKLKRVTNEFQ